MDKAPPVSAANTASEFGSEINTVMDILNVKMVPITYRDLSYRDSNYNFQLPPPPPLVPPRPMAPPPQRPMQPPPQRSMAPPPPRPMAPPPPRSMAPPPPRPMEPLPSCPMTFPPPCPMMSPPTPCFYGVENNRLRCDLDLLKKELNNCYSYMSGQNAQIQKLKNLEEVLKKRIEREKKGRKNSTEKHQAAIKKLEKKVLEQEIDLQVLTAKVHEQQTEMENMKIINNSHQERIKKHENQIKELENTKTEGETAISQLESDKSQLELEKMTFDGKLKGIREFMKLVNEEFLKGLENLKKDDISFDIDAYKFDASAIENAADDDDDEDEKELKNLERNLSNLAALVKDTLEDFEKTKLAEKTRAYNISKISLKKQTDNNGSSKENWTIVSDKENSEDTQTLTFFSTQESDHQKFPSGKRSTTNWSSPFFAKLGRCRCGFKAKSSTELKEHLKVHSAAKKFPCTLCKRKFLDLQRLKVHYQADHKIPQGMSRDCTACLKTFPTVGEFHRHIQLVHRKRSAVVVSDEPKEVTEDPFDFMYEIPSISDNVEESRPHVCPTCYCAFESLESLEQHKMDGGIYTCSLESQSTEPASVPMEEICKQLGFQ